MLIVKGKIYRLQTEVALRRRLGSLRFLVGSALLQNDVLCFVFVFVLCLMYPYVASFPTLFILDCHFRFH